MIRFSLRRLYIQVIAVPFLAALCSSVLAVDPNRIDQTVAKIDQLLSQSWDRDGVVPVSMCGDAEFCRRVWLDFAGVAPPVAELRSFLADNSMQKRAKLIDRLLQSPRHASHMAARWSDTLLPDDLGPQSRANVSALHRWLRMQFIKNAPYDHLVGGFLTAGGDGNSGPAIFYTAHGLAPEKIAAATSRIFMGMQLQCAECHDHPFDRWTQDEFWSYAAFFGQLESRENPQGRTTFVFDRPGGEVKFPESDRVMQPLYPGVNQPPDDDPANNRRRQLTIWLASRDNPYFARAAVNRVWGHLFARGLVDPVDAMDANNPPSHPELLSFLADYFVELRFDLRSLYATIGRTKAYQLTSAMTASERPPADSFAVMQIKTLTPQQYYDSLAQNVFLQVSPTSSEQGAMSNPQRDAFLQRMGSNRESASRYPHGIVQVLGLLNGPEIDAASSGQSGLLVAGKAPFFTDRDRIETIFLAVLSRMPGDLEYARCESFLNSASDEDAKREVYRDLVWALLNTAECAVCP